MKTINALVTSLVILIVSAPCDLRACWTDVPLEDVIKAKPLVVVGEIKRIETAPKSDYSYDTAFIKIERVLKSTGTNKFEKVGTEISLAMPSANNNLRISTDLRYRNGQRGVWILSYRDGKYWATYPKDFQDISEEIKIAAIVKLQTSK